VFSKDGWKVEAERRADECRARGVHYSTKTCLGTLTSCLMFLPQLVSKIDGESGMAGH